MYHTESNSLSAPTLQQPTQYANGELVSIIIPAYNRALLIQEAIASVIAQTHVNWELIIVDDGSFDNTVDIIRSINDPRVHVIPVSHKGHLGILRNIGAMNSCGKWLAFLDSDDLWTATKLQKQLQLLHNEKTRWAYSGSELIDENKKAIPKKMATSRPCSGWIAREILTTEADFAISSLIVEKKYFDEVGGFTTDPALFCREDHELILRLALYAKASFIPDIIVRTREHTGRTTNTLDESHDRSAAVYNTFLRYNVDKSLEKLARKQRAYHLAEASVRRFAKGEYKIAIRQLTRSFWDSNNKWHWLSAVKRGIFMIGKKYFRSLKKRKTLGQHAIE